MALSREKSSTTSGPRPTKKPAKAKRTPEQVAADKAAKALAKTEQKRELEAQKKVQLAREASDPAAFLEKLKKALTQYNQLVTLAEIAKPLKAPLKAVFLELWSGALETGTLPEGVGSLLMKSGSSAPVRKFFLLSDVVPSLVSAPTTKKFQGAAPPSAEALKGSLLAEFDRLKEASGGAYHIPLFDLRGAFTGVPRSAFDEALNALRRDWILTLSPAEGLHESVPQHFLDAGIVEQSKHLIYAARRES